MNGERPQIGSASPDGEPNERTPKDSVDRALVAGMAKADPAAMEALYDLYANELYGLIRGMVPDPADAQELLQETLWHAWRYAPRYDPARASVRTWLHVIMRSRVLDWRRRELQRPAFADLEHAREVTDPSASTAIAAAADREDLNRAEARLPDAERQAIRLIYYRGLTQAEAARTLGIPLGTLKSRVRSALGRLHEGIDRTAWEEGRG